MKIASPVKIIFLAGDKMYTVVADKVSFDHRSQMPLFIENFYFSAERVELKTFEFLQELGDFGKDTWVKGNQYKFKVILLGQQSYEFLGCFLSKLSSSRNMLGFNEISIEAELVMDSMQSVSIPTLAKMRIKNEIY